MDKKDFKEQLEINPIIAAVSSVEDLEEAIKSPCEIIFLLFGDIFNVEYIVEKIKKNNKDIFIHVDLIKGLSNDEVALKYLSDTIKPTGIITTKASLILNAKTMGLKTIQRIFILDSKSLEGGVNSVQMTMPDAVELMPGLIPEITKEVSQSINIPIITGGLIDEKKEVLESLKSGATSISTSSSKMWYI